MKKLKEFTGELKKNLPDSYYNLAMFNNDAKEFIRALKMYGLTMKEVSSSTFHSKLVIKGIGFLKERNRYSIFSLNSFFRTLGFKVDSKGCLVYERHGVVANYGIVYMVSDKLKSLRMISERECEELKEYYLINF